MPGLFRAQTRRRALLVAGAFMAQITKAVAVGNGDDDDCQGDQSRRRPCDCVASGTLIATPGGEQRVDDIRSGDLLLSSRGVVPVRFVGHFRRRPSWAWRPVLIRAGSLADGVPARDLVVTPDHAVFLDGMLVCAGDLVNGLSIVDAPPSSGLQIFFHVELEQHNVILAEGAWVESLRPINGHAGFDNNDGEPAPDRSRLTPFAPIMGVKGGREAARALAVSLIGRCPDARLDALQRRLWERATRSPWAAAA